MCTSTQCTSVQCTSVQVMIETKSYVPKNYQAGIYSEPFLKGPTNTSLGFITSFHCVI